MECVRRFAPKIDNPAYKGVWAPRKIENPDFFEDDVPYAFSPIAGVAFEWWTMQENIMVDNVSVRSIQLGPSGSAKC